MPTYLRGREPTDITSYLALGALTSACRKGAIDLPVNVSNALYGKLMGALMTSRE